MVDVDRREFLRKALAAGVLIVPVSGMVTGCATAGGGDQEQAKGEVSKSNPLGVDPKAALEVITFAGGLKTTFPEVQKTYAARFKGADLNVKGIVNINSLQPRFSAGDPPDLVHDAGAQKIPLGALVGGKQLADLKPLLDAPSLDDPAKKVRDTIVPEAIESGAMNGTVYAAYYVLLSYGLWYSQPLFAEKGWEVPQQWSDFVALCGEMKQANLSPMCFGGQNATQYITEMLLTMAGKAGGNEVLVKIDNLEPDAWSQPALEQAAQAIEELATKKYFLPGSASLTHTQAQTEWVKGKVACYASGSWIENEMKSVAPKNFDMAMAPVPSLSSSDKLPVTALHTRAGEPFIVPSKAANARGGMEFLRHMLATENALAFSELTSSLTIVQAANDKLQAKTPGLKSVLAALSASEKQSVNYMYDFWYGDMWKASTEAMADLIAGRKNAEQFIQACQAATDKTAGDDKIEKYTRQ